MVNLRYRIDGGDLITDVSESWAAFAVANDAEELAQPLAGRPIWDFVSGDTTREVYRELFARVRGGRIVTFPYRCDSPGLRRFMRMKLSAAADGSITFDSATLRTEARQPIELLAGDSGDAGLVTVCSWCKRVEVLGEWVAAEIAVERLGLFGASVPGAMTHGACGECISLILHDDDGRPPVTSIAR